MEDKVVTISRVGGSASYPANFSLIGAMNPCPCGYNNHPTRACVCSPGSVARYQKRISGPLLDRIDIFIEVPPVEYEKLVTEGAEDGSSQVRRRVEEARDVQRSRFEDAPLASNSEMGPEEVWRHCQTEDNATGVLQSAMKQLDLSARGFHRILKLSRTIADLAGSTTIGVDHVAEALQYRPRGMG
jgi:magnesium chelatase family protein